MKRSVIAQIAVLITISLAALYGSAVGLQGDFYPFAPLLLFPPVILAAYWFPRQGIYFSLALGLLLFPLSYLGLLTGMPLPGFALTTASFYVLVAAAVTVSSLSSRLKSEEGRYQGIFDRCVAGMVMARKKDGEVLGTDINIHGAAMLDYGEGDFRGSSLASIFARYQDYKVMMETLDQEGMILNREVTLRAHNGDQKPSLLSATLVPDDLILVTFIDIGQRMAAEKAIHESEKKYRTLFENSSVGIFLMNDRFIDCNEQLATLLGCPRDRIIGYDPSGFFPPLQPDGTPSESSFRDHTASATLGHPEHFSWRYQREDKSPLDTEMTLKALETPDGKVLFATLHDVTERLRAEEALVKANAKLNLLSSVTRHDVFNQLTIMTGYLELARLKARSPDVKDYLSKVETAAETIYRQISFTRIYQDIGTSSPAWQDLRKTFDKSLEGLDTGKISFALPPEGLWLFADPLLEKVFFNLVDNSLRHGGTVSRISLEADPSAGSLVLVYRDDGEGIPPGEREEIFKRGYGKNTGYGLFLIREILSITGLSIKETGTPGEGARFEIHVPEGSYRLAP
ncbi:PAS domain S-box-containing protein [Methanolinea mesophila]|uniref:PAS domain-containing sensor histidine kinase n=1 Tax=Methanolinea mesophila TaxID=547055 RepID=UPI001AE2B3D2|nr:ATP-binding protein [Methanolinea mesophila]MBP1927505.1 PAS domain S-box-containing protein [Methanolinea mesophila]